MIAIINYGLSNLLSIERAVRLFTDQVIVTDKKKDVLAADKIILPGVGAFDKGMEKMNALGLVEVVTSEAKNGKPLFGICLGMQMLFNSSEEGTKYKGLGLIDGQVKRIPNETVTGELQNVPHICWETLDYKELQPKWPNIFEGVELDKEYYFVHSYYGCTSDSINAIATATYGGRDICAVAQNDRIIGCQFHPEKSGEAGIKLIDNFVKLF